MSHYSVLVSTKHVPTDGTLTPLMQPWHEFESDGVSDIYVQDVDMLPQHIEFYNNGMVDRLKKDGELFNPWDIPTENRGEYEEVSVPVKSIMTQQEVVEDDGIVRCIGEPDVEGQHKYGWYKMDDEGKITELVKRTNPDSRWDYWLIGGRWEKGLLSKKDGEWHSTLKKKDLDIEGMEAIERKRRLDHVENTLTAIAAKNGVTKEEVIRVHAAAVAKKERNSPESKLAFEYGLYSWDDGLCSVVENSDLLSEPDPYKWVNGDLNVVAFSILHEGKWESKALMGWWACTSNEVDDWSNKAKAIVATIPDDYWLAIVDCHI